MMVSQAFLTPPANRLTVHILAAIGRKVSFFLYL
jgi:hypothetical protein